MSSTSFDSREERTVYVRNLHEKVTKEILEELFLQMGTLVSVALKESRPSLSGQSASKNGSSNRFAFVEFQDVESVLFAVEMLDDVALFGQNIHLAPRDRTHQSEMYKKLQDQFLTTRIRHTLNTSANFSQLVAPTSSLHSSPLLSHGCHPVIPNHLLISPIPARRSTDTKNNFNALNTQMGMRDTERKRVPAPRKPPPTPPSSITFNKNNIMKRPTPYYHNNSSHEQHGRARQNYHESTDSSRFRSSLPLNFSSNDYSSRRNFNSSETFSRKSSRHRI